MLRHLVLAAVLVILSTGLARAQVTDIGSGLPDETYYPGFAIDYEGKRSYEDLERDRQIEQKYREVVDTRIPDRKPSKDPWGNIRQAPVAAVPYDRYRPQ
jgi:hypothetical protein